MGHRSSMMNARKAVKAARAIEEALKRGGEQSAFSARQLSTLLGGFEGKENGSVAVVETSRNESQPVETIDSTKLTVPGNIIKPVQVWDDKNGKWGVLDRLEGDWPRPFNQRITPDFADEVIKHRNRNNRRVDWSRVETYINAIYNNTFYVIPNGIGFYDDGVLADGQHRLLAVIETNQPVNMVVVYGIDDEAGIVIDEGRPRTLKDVANIHGMDVTGLYVSAANYVLQHYGINPKKLGRHESLAYMERHSEALHWTVTNLKTGSMTKGVAIAPVAATIWRGYESRPEHRNRLAEFVEILNTGMCLKEEDRPALHLREWLKNRVQENGASAQAEKYGKTQTALHYFLTNSQFERLHAARTEHFPISDKLELNGK